MQLYFKEIDSPVGLLKLVAHDDALVAVLWENEEINRVKLSQLILNDDHILLKKTEHQLQEYFSNKRTVFDLPLEFHGTEFQKKIWQALLEIPYGETRTYKEIAQAIGNCSSNRKCSSSKSCWCG